MGGTGGSHNFVDDGAAVAAVLDALAPIVPRAARVILAVSGGADSVGMAHLVVAARPDLRPQVVHVRHGLRDDAADAGAAQACAEALGLDAEVIEVDVPADGTGPENAARVVRYEALGSAAERAGASYVLTGHTAEDQAETVLLNIARGTGLAGVAGIPAVRSLTDGVLLVRPVLGLRRAAVRAAATATGLPIADDPTNRDPRQPRSVARHELLPLLTRLTGGGTDPVEALARLAGHARSDAAALDMIAAAQADALVQQWGSVVTVAAEALDALPLAIGSRVLRIAVAQAGAGVGAPPADASVRSLLRLRDGQALTLAAGLNASRGGGYLALGSAAPTAPERPLRGASVALPEVGLVLRCGRDETPGVLPPWAPARAAAGVGVNDVAGVVVRTRRPGDRIRTAAGTQRITDAMISAHVPRIARDRLPVVADDEGVLWVPGVAVRAGTDGPWRLRFEVAAGQ